MFKLIDGIINMFLFGLTGKTLKDHGCEPEEKEPMYTDEDLLTYSLLTGNKEMEKAMLWKIWSK